MNPQQLPRQAKVKVVLRISFLGLVKIFDQYEIASREARNLRVAAF